MLSRAYRLALAGALATPLLAFGFGGWAVVTVDDVPTHLVTGRRTTIGFMVRQHGMMPLPMLSPAVKIHSGDQESIVRATPSGTLGHYEATVMAPSPGSWTVTVLSGFGNSKTTLLPIRAVAPGAPAARETADAERGRQLFHGKGCVTCHVRGSDGGESMNVGPVLTGRRYPAEYVAKFLDDPDSSPLSKANAKPGFKMPKLGLSDREISALVAFLNTAEVAQR